MNRTARWPDQGMHMIGMGLGRFWWPLKEKHSYKHLLFMLVSVLLGTGYLLFLLSGSILSLGTLFIWIGLPLALFMLFACQAIASFERRMARVWLGQEIIPPARVEADGTLLQRLQAFLRSATTWKGLAYLVLKALPGLFVAIFILSMTVAGLNFLFGTLAYLFNLVIHALYHLYPIPLTSFEHVNISLIVPLGTPFAGLNKLSAPLLALHLGFDALVGLVLSICSLHLSNGAARVWGRLAGLLLSASREELQLLEAQLLAEQARARAEEADQKRRVLITNVSHELRTPVASIQGHVEVLLNAYSENASPEPEMARHYLGIVQREAFRLGALVDDLLALARTERDELHFKLKRIAAAEVVEEVYHTLVQLARRERQITLVRHVETDLPPILADRQRLVQVLLNLARNAIAYTPEGGIVSLTLKRADEQHLAIVVSDTGVGIPTEELSHIFERFYRVDPSRSQRSGGSGLGLAIVKEFVEAMGGSISVESTPGEGSTFCVHLPINQDIL